MKPIVGLTGGIASGKSTVAKMFGEMGIPVIDADELAREIVAPGTAGLKALVQAFGQRILHHDGTLDREKLAELAFNDAVALQHLNKITHPLIAQSSQQLITQYQNTAAPFIIYEATLLVENRAYLAFSALVVVDVSEKTQLTRAQQRSNMSVEQVMARIRAQASAEERRAAATFVIDNNGDRAALEAQVRQVYKDLVARFATS